MKTITILLLIAMSLSIAEAKENQISKKMRILPVHGLTMVEANGKTVLVSNNSRFMITSFKLFDLLNKQEIKSLEDAKSLDKILLDKINLNFSDLGSIDYGQGESEVTLFVDPLCPYCKKLLKEITVLSESYRFHIVVTPLLGQPSLLATRKLLCHSKPAERFQLLTKGDYEELAQPAKGCGAEQIKKVLVTSEIMGFQAVPFIIAPDGVSHTGAPKEGLVNWLKQHRRGS